MHTGKQKQMNASYQASLVNRHIRRFTGVCGWVGGWVGGYVWYLELSREPKHVAQ